MRYARELRALPSDLSTDWRLEGMRGVRRDLWARSARRLVSWGRCEVYEQDLRYAKNVEPPDGITISQLGDSDWPALAEIMTSRQLDLYQRAIHRGRHCSLAWRDDHVVGYLFSSDVMQREFELFDLQLPPNASYGWQLYVIPAERNQGVGTALVSARQQHALERGRDVSWRLVRSSNFASKATWRKTADPSHPVEYRGEMRWIKIWRFWRSRFIPVSRHD